MPDSLWDAVQTFIAALEAGDESSAVGVLVEAVGTKDVHIIHTLALTYAAGATDFDLGMRLTRHLLTWEEAEIDDTGEIFIIELMPTAWDEACRLLAEDGRFEFNSDEIEQFEDGGYSNALACAASHSLPRTVEALLDDPGYPIHGGVSAAAITSAINERCDEVFDLLLGSGRIDPGDRDNYCLQYCALTRNKEYLDRLLADPRTSLTEAIKGLKYEMDIDDENVIYIGDEPRLIEEALEWLKEEGYGN